MTRTVSEKAPNMNLPRSPSVLLSANDMRPGRHDDLSQRVAPLLRTDPSVSSVPLRWYCPRQLPC